MEVDYLRTRKSSIVCAALGLLVAQVEEGETMEAPSRIQQRVPASEPRIRFHAFLASTICPISRLPYGSTFLIHGTGANMGRICSVSWFILSRVPNADLSDSVCFVCSSSQVGWVADNGTHGIGYYFREIGAKDGSEIALGASLEISERSRLTLIIRYFRVFVQWLFVYRMVSWKAWRPLKWLVRSH